MERAFVWITHERRDDEGRAGEGRVRRPDIFKEFWRESNGAGLPAAFLRTRAQAPVPGALLARWAKHFYDGRNQRRLWMGQLGTGQDRQCALRSRQNAGNHYGGG